MNADVRVSVLVPMLDEADDIAGCIERIGAQSYVRDGIEVVLIDAESTDGTVALAIDAAGAARLHVVVVANPDRRTSIGLNRGLAVASGMYVVRVDARSRIEPDYVERCVETLSRRGDVGVVGGAQIATARSGSVRDRSIARALNNRWLTGLARYRRHVASGPTDTVWMGAFRAAELRAIGGWNPQLGINEDYELNERYRAGGSIVWFDSVLRSGYLPRARLRDLARQYAAFGRAKAARWINGARPAPRHFALVAMPPALAAATLGAAVVVGVLPVVIAAALAAVAVELAGAPSRAPLRVHAGALVANAVIAASWWWGVVAGCTRSVRTRGRSADTAVRPTR